MTHLLLATDNTVYIVNINKRGLITFNEDASVTKVIDLMFFDSFELAENYAKLRYDCEINTELAWI